MHGVYARGKCDPSLDRDVTQVSDHSLAQSSHLTFLSFMTGSSGTQPSPEKTPLHTVKCIFELEGKHLTVLDMPAALLF